MSMTMDNKTARPSQGAEEVPRAADVELATMEEATAPRRRGGRSIRSRLGLLAARLLLGAALVGLWQLVVEAEIWDPTVTSNPSDVASYLWDAVGSSTLWSNLGVTMQAVVLAFLLASAVGIVVGISLALLPKLERVVSPYLDAVNAMRASRWPRSSSSASG
jgi:NitT/TauT family transport system permease protein